MFNLIWRRLPSQDSYFVADGWLKPGESSPTYQAQGRNPMEPLFHPFNMKLIFIHF